MVGQKQRIIRRFEREAKKKNKLMREAGLQCACGKCNLAIFKLEEIKDIISWDDLNAKGEQK